MHSALTKPEILALATDRGRPISGALAGVILTVTGGCPETVAIAVGAAQRPAADVPVTKVVADAVHGHQVAALRSMNADEQGLVALAHFGVGGDLDVLADLIGPAVDAGAVLDRGVAIGVLGGSAAALPGVESALRASMGERRFTSMLNRLLEYRITTGTLQPETALALVRDGISNPQLAEFLVAAAERAAPASASTLYEYAAAAGADAQSLAVQRAETAALLGDLDAAERLCDSILDRFDSVDAFQLRTAVRISATVAAERGMSSRSLQLYSWLGADRAASDTPLASTVALIAGDFAGCRAMASSATPAPPTSASAANTLLASGVEQSVTASSTAETIAATNTMLRAVSLSGDTSRQVVPCSAAATATLFALHCGDLALARSTASKALTKTGPAVPQHPGAVRLALLLAWSAMLAGSLTAAQSGIDALTIPLSHSRNQLFLHGLRVGLARRSSDAGSLLKAWDEAQDVIAAYSVDLLSLLPVGELWLAAVRVGQPEKVTHLIAQAEAVAAGLNQPQAWTSTVHWYGVQAAILAGQPTELVPHARALAEAAGSNHYAAALTTAGRAWLAVLQGHPDVAEVERAAQALERFGLSWDGARLASEAALRVDDTRSATTLLQVARSLRSPSSEPASVATEIKGPLSAREAEVAELLVLGVTYREVGARLYISAKTVEHHVARIRRRLGAGSRSELLSMLRALGYGANSPDSNN